MLGISCDSSDESHKKSSLFCFLKTDIKIWKFRRLEKFIGAFRAEPCPVIQLN